MLCIAEHTACVLYGYLYVLRELDWQAFLIISFVAVQAASNVECSETTIPGRGLVETRPFYCEQIDCFLLGC